MYSSPPYTIVVQSLSCVWLFATPWTAVRQASLSFTILLVGACSNSCPLSRWCHPTISSSVVSFSCCLQSFPASGSFPMSQLFTSGGQSIGGSASASVLPMNTQDWSSLGWTGWISLQSKGLSRVFSKSQFKSISSLALSLLYGPTLAFICDNWKNHSFDWMDFCQQSNVCFLMCCLGLSHIVTHCLLQLVKGICLQSWLIVTHPVTLSLFLPPFSFSIKQENHSSRHTQNPWEGNKNRWNRVVRILFLPLPNPILKGLIWLLEVWSQGLFSHRNLMYVCN